MEFFKFIYYAIGLFFLIYEIIWLFTSKNRIEGNKKARKFLKEIKDNKEESIGWDSWPSHTKAYLFQALLIVFPLFMWEVMGLLTFNWLVHLSMLVLSIAIFAPVSKLLTNTPVYRLFCILNTIMLIAFILFVTLNSYHLKIDTFQLIKSLI